MTKSNKIQQNNEETKLTDRQLKAIPVIVANSTYTEGCKKAKINRTTFYEWLKIPEFKAELDRQRDEVASDAFGVLSQNLTKAVETLACLLGNKDDRLKRLAAKDVIDFFVRHKENVELEKRLTAIEQKQRGKEGVGQRVLSKDELRELLKDDCILPFDEVESAIAH